MSDTAGASGSPEPVARKKGCCLRLAVLSLLLLLLVAGYLGWAVRAALQPAPLPFEPFRFELLEETALRAKLELNELPGRLLGGPTEVELDQRQLNGLLFGQAAHTAEDKARVQIEGRLLRVEVSKPAPDRPGQWVNVVATLEVSVGPDLVRVEVVEGRVGDYELGPLTKPWFSKQLTQGLSNLREKDAALSRLKAFWVEGDRARLVYTR